MEVLTPAPRKSPHLSVDNMRKKKILKTVKHDQDFLRLGSGFSFSVQRKFYWNALLITDYMSFFAFK